MCSLKGILAFHLLPFASSPSSPYFLVFSPVFLPLLFTPSPCSNLYITNPSPTFSWKSSQLVTKTRVLWFCHKHIYNQAWYTKYFNINTSLMRSNQSMGMHQSYDIETPCCARFNSLIPGIQEGEMAGFGGRGCNDQKTPETWQNWDSGYFINGTEVFPLGSITTQCQTLRLIPYMCLNSRKPSVRVGDSPHGFQIRLLKTRW